MPQTSQVPPTQFARLLAAACRGEQWAFTDLWAAYAPRIHGFVRARGSADPEALTNDVFLAVFSRIEQFNGGPDAFAALLFTVTRRRLVDEQRRRGRRPTEHEWCPEEDLRVTASAEESVLDRAAAAEARALLQALSPEQRDVLLLRIYGDLSIDQIAALLGKRAGAVKALQRRALAALRSQDSRRSSSPDPHSQEARS